MIGSDATAAGLKLPRLQLARGDRGTSITRDRRAVGLGMRSTDRQGVAVERVPGRRRTSSGRSPRCPASSAIARSRPCEARDQPLQLDRRQRHGSRRRARPGRCARRARGWPGCARARWRSAGCPRAWRSPRAQCSASRHDRAAAADARRPSAHRSSAVAHRPARPGAARVPTRTSRWVGSRERGSVRAPRSGDVIGQRHRLAVQLGGERRAELQPSRHLAVERLTASPLRANVRER